MERALDKALAQHFVSLTKNDGDSSYNSIYKTKIDSVVYSVMKQFAERAEFGMKKYGTNLDRTDLGVLDWIQHAQEEHMDAILYLEKLKQVVANGSVGEVNTSEK